MPLHSAAAGTDLHEDKRVKQPVRAASTANVTLATPGASIDGVTLSSGDRVLLKDQTAPAENGIYVWTGAATALTRATDADAAADFVHLFLVGVREGTANAATIWKFTQSAAITLGTTALTFAGMAGSGTVTSVAMTVPSEFSVSGSPITGSGTLAVSKTTQSANQVFAGPTSGGAATPAFRALVTADLPAGIGSTSGIGAPLVGDIFQQTVIQGTGNKTTTSTTFAVIDNTNLPALSLPLSTGDTVRCILQAQTYNNSSGAGFFDWQVVQPTLGTVRANASTDGGVGTQQATNRTSVSIIATFTAAEAGTHTFQPMWRTTSATQTLANATSGTDDTAIVHTVEKIGAMLTLPYVLVEDQKSSGTAGGTFTNGAWRTRDLNTEVEDTHAIASVASNQITLPIGTYSVRAACQSSGVGSNQARIQDITGATTLLLGMSTTGETAEVVGRFELAVASAIEVQHRCQTTVSTTGFGTATSWGTEKYTVIEIRKEV